MNFFDTNIKKEERLDIDKTYPNKENHHLKLHSSHLAHMNTIDFDETLLDSEKSHCKKL